MGWLILLVAIGGAFWYWRYKSGEDDAPKKWADTPSLGSGSSTTSAYRPKPYAKYGLNSYLLRVEGPPRPYRRENGLGTVFTGTEVSFMTVNEGRRLNLSFEGKTISANAGDVAIAIMASYEVLGTKSALPVVFINKSQNHSITMISDNIEKTANGSRTMNEDLFAYMKDEHKIQIT